VQYKYLVYSYIYQMNRVNSCKQAPWFGTPHRMISMHSRTMSPLDSEWIPGFL